MRNKNVLILAIVTLMAAAPLAADTPFGRLDLVSGSQGAVGVVGWALADTGIDRIIVEVDGEDIGEANHGFHRADVQIVFPGYPDSAGAGFHFKIDSTRFNNGLHTVEITARSFGGGVKTIGYWVTEFLNTPLLLDPFGELESPMELAEILGECDMAEPRIYSVFSGWALDLGIDIIDQGVSWVELYFDGARLLNTRTDCITMAPFGLANCYGLRRLDIEREYPFAPDAPYSGYQFVLDVGYMMNNGWTQGRHNVSIRAGDVLGNWNVIDDREYLFRCREANQAAFGVIEYPGGSGIHGGIVPVHGWTLDADGVAAVDVLVDGEMVASAVTGLARPDIAAIYPGFPDSLTAGWSAAVDSTQFGDGWRDFAARVWDLDGNSTIIGEVSVQIQNSPD